MKIDPKSPAFPCEGPNPYSHGLTIRAYFAGLAMQGMLAQGGESTYQTSWVDEDFAPTAGGQYFKHANGGYWTRAIGKNESGTHKVVTSYEHRMARDALAHADALIAALNAELKP